MCALRNIILLCESRYMIWHIRVQAASQLFHGSHFVRVPMKYPQNCEGSQVGRITKNQLISMFHSFETNCFAQALD